MSIEYSEDSLECYQHHDVDRHTDVAEQEEWIILTERGIQAHEGTTSVEISVGLQGQIEGGEDEVRDCQRDDEQSGRVGPQFRIPEGGDGEDISQGSNYTEYYGKY